MKDLYLLLFSLLFWPRIAMQLAGGFDELTASADLLRDYWAAEYQVQYDALREALRCNLEDGARYLKQRAPSTGRAVDGALAEFGGYLAYKSTVDPGPGLHFVSESYLQRNPALPAGYPNWYYRFTREKPHG